MNAAWVHPGLLLRQFAQLAVLLGGERVTAGLGAGGAPRSSMRSASSCPASGRGWTGWRRCCALRGACGATARDPRGPARRRPRPPASPVPDRPPRLLVGGGSDRVLEMAGRFADLLDLHGDPKHGRVAGATMARAAAGDVARRALTTVEDLAGADRAGARRRQRRPVGPRDAVGVATQIWYAAFGSPAEVRAAEEELCARWAGIPYRPPGPQPVPAVRQPGADGRGAGRAARGLRPPADLAQRGGRDRGRATGPAPVLP